MDRRTYEELKKLLLLLLTISFTGFVCQISMVSQKYGKYGNIMQRITLNLREDYGHGPYRVPKVKTADLGTESLVMDLTNFSKTSNETLDNSPIDRKSMSWENWLYLMETRQMIRTDRMNRLCTEMNRTKYTPDELLVRKGLRATLYSNDRYNITFSVVKKAASNNFQNLFKSIGGLTRLYSVSEEMCKPRLETHTRAVFVRHPLSRFLSAYIDKFVLHHIDHFLSIGRIIIDYYRRNVTRRERLKAMKKADDVKLEEFIQYIVKSPKHRRNTHWNNYWSHNRACELRFDFIGKLETIQDDVRFMLYKLKVENRDNIEFLKPYVTYHGKQEKLRKYYKNVSLPLLRQLYSIYHMDFKMFGYDMEILGHEIWS
ncbi:Carbohydrate sulfotransferase 11 [Holothuria leucospilota]|uniref:Carbohydrate sulfotransferase n=1 Tax=Holothuria leucospilota TaxID=206669 RepID=A0A9Q0YGK0_HOLLE|nr:Carbohydrate sulfotransferase 11 [Holothuria leucospilota]